MSPDTKDPNYTYKVLAQTLAANVRNDKLSDASFRQFVTNCVQEFIPPRDASMAAAHAQHFGAKDEAQLQLRTDIWQFKGSTVYKLQDTGFIGSSQFQNEYLFNVQYVPLRGDGSSQAERDSRKEKMAQHVASALNAWNSPQPRNDFWSILVFSGGSVQVFHTKEDPAKDKRIVERASLIIPPNDIVPVKDRFGMFSRPSLTFLTLAQIQRSLQKSIFELKEDESHA